MSVPGCLYVPPGSRIRPFAEAVAWLWRLGPVLASPDPSAVGIGWLEEAGELDARQRAGELAGAAVFATRPGPGEGTMPNRSRWLGVADFGDAGRVSGQFCLLDGGEAVVRSSLGVHAVRDGGLMFFGADPEACWGALDGFWVLPALADFLAERLERPLVMMPALGWVRFDDLPGTAYHQVSGRDKPDDKVRRRIEKAVELFAENDAVLNLAVAARAFVDGAEAPIDEVWPGSIAAIADGVERGALEHVCHGYLHLDTEAWARGEIVPEEFAHVEREEAARRLDVALAWARETLGAAPRTFVAPTWAYSAGLIEALGERGLPAWMPPYPGPLVSNGNGRETLFSTMEGLHRLEYGPIGTMSRSGLPPSVVLHGGLFDMRAGSVRRLREAPTTARLLLTRDLFRFPWVEGVRWIGAGELYDRMRAHDRIEVDGERIENPGGFDLVVQDSSGRQARQ